MKKFWLVALCMGLTAIPGHAFDEFKLPVNLEKLAARATETVDVTLDSSMLQLASKFLSSDDPDDAQVKRVVSKLKSVVVRSFEFDKEGEYSMHELDLLRDQLKSPVWSRIVGVKSVKGENADIYIKHEGDRVGGLVVIATEPKELTIVHIDGNIDLDELTELGGHMGIPKIDTTKSDAKKKDREKKEEE